jgi:oligo-1,6-glucosidase
VRPEGLIDSRDIYLNGPRMHEFLQEMNRECLKGYDIMTVGEAFGTSPEEALLYTGEDRNELNMIFQFEHTTIDWGKDKWESVPYEPTKLKDVLIKWQHALENEGWNSQFLSNHDSPRQVSRFGDDREYRIHSAKMLATMLHTLIGTPFIYQGEELGMANPGFDSAEDYRDIETLNMIRDSMKDSDRSLQSVMDAAKRISRDNSRTPMQWTDEKNAGFTTGEPWIRPNPDYTEVNAQAQVNDPASVLSYYKKMIALRRKYKAIVYGTFKALEAGDGDMFAYTREYEGEKLFILLNLSGRAVNFTLPEEIRLASCELLTSNYEGTAVKVPNQMRPYEAMVFKLTDRKRV